MKTTQTTRNNNFRKLIEATKNREHDLHGVPLVMILGAMLEIIKQKGIDAGYFQLGMICEKVGMFDHFHEITNYVAQNPDAARSDIIDHLDLNW